MRFAGLLLVLFASATAAQAKPNVIFIMADDLGWAELGCYGQKIIRTPHIDELAKRGMRFTQFYSGSPVCAPARCCLMTGKHGGHAYIRDNKEAKPEGQHPLPATEVTLAERFKALGYTTGAIGKWGLGPPGSEGDPLTQGIDFFYGYNCQRHAHSHYPTWLYNNREKIELTGNDGKKGTQFSHDLFEVETLKFVRDHAKEPFFLYLPYIIPHVAVQAPEDAVAEYRGKFDDPPYDGKKGYVPHPTPRAAYAAMVTRMDATIGKLVKLLDDLKIADNTIICFTSDNGPTHNGVGGSDSTFFRSAGELRGWKGEVYEGGLRVPFIAVWPGKIAAGSTSALPAYFPDVTPTLLELIGSTAPTGLDGMSIAPTLLGKPQPAERPFMFWEFAGYGGQQAVRMGDWKGVKRGLQKGPAKLELYHLKNDPNEQSNIAEQHPDIVAKIETILRTERTPSTIFPIKGLPQP